MAGEFFNHAEAEDGFTACMMQDMQTDHAGIEDAVVDIPLGPAHGSHSNQNMTARIFLARMAKRIENKALSQQDKTARIFVSHFSKQDVH